MSIWDDISNLGRWTYEVVLGASFGLGFELAGQSLNVFEGVQGFFCWIMTRFLDMVEEAMYEGVELLPGGGFVSLQDLQGALGLFKTVDEYMPLTEWLGLVLIWWTFWFLWLGARTILRLVWV